LFAASSSQPEAISVAGPEAAQISSYLFLPFGDLFKPNGRILNLRNYETAIIWSTATPESDLDAEIEKVVEIIGKAKGTYANTEKWGKRIFAYPIKKQTEGIYCFVRWSGEEKTTAAIDKHLSLQEECLRYMTIRMDDGEIPEPHSGEEE